MFKLSVIQFLVTYGVCPKTLILRRARHRQMTQGDKWTDTGRLLFTRKMRVENVRLDTDECCASIGMAPTDHQEVVLRGLFVGILPFFMRYSKAVFPQLQLCHLRYFRSLVYVYIVGDLHWQVPCYTWFISETVVKKQGLDDVDKGNTLLIFIHVAVFDLRVCSPRSSGHSWDLLLYSVCLECI